MPVRHRRPSCSCRLLVLGLQLVLSHAFSFKSMVLPSQKDEQGFIGWAGEQGNCPCRGGSADCEDRVTVLSWDPKIFLYSGLLSPAECDALMEQATPRLQRSGVADSKTGRGTTQNVRTSSGMFFKRNENELVKRIEDRVGKWVMVNPDFGEGLQVLKYNETQKYDAHHDYFSFEGRDDNGGNRMVTVLMYLTDVELGGETVFPKVPISEQKKAEARAQGVSECGLRGLHYRPRKGDAIAFWSINNDGRFEPKSLHGSCPVIQGIKWSATKWIHVGHYALPGEKQQKVERVIMVPPPPPASPGCTNKHSMCNSWAETGECDSNPGYMLGHPGSPGACLLACNRCDLGPNDPGARS